MWFTEDPWPPILILAVFAVVFGIAWNATRRGSHLLITIGLVALAGLVFVVEELILTESEHVEARVYALADSVKEGNLEKVIEFVSMDAAGLRREIRSAMENVDVDEDLRITDLQVALDESDGKAKSHFRANGTGTWKKTLSHTFTTRWNLTWKKEGEAWRILQIEQLDPIKGDVINEWKSL